MISPETIALVRDRTDIVAVLSESIPSLKRRGRSFVGLCPFHKEKTPSFHVNPDRGFFHCFGCKEAGSVIDFLMKHDGYTFPEAVRALAERAGIEVVDDKADREGHDAQARARKAKDDLYAVTQLAATWFEEQLREHPHRGYAEEELARRGLSPTDDVVQAFRIGYAPAAWDGLAQFLRGQGVSPMAAESVGLLVPRSSGSGHYDRFRHRLMFAVVDPQGRVVAFSGRALKDPPGAEPTRDPPPKYINSPESPIYTKGSMLFGIFQARHAIRSEEVAILVEGNFDVVSLHASGFGNVVAPLGTAFTVDQAKMLKRFAGDVIVCFDGDAAGRKATRLAREPLRQAGLSARVAVLPAGQDPDEMVRTKGPQALREVLTHARGVLEYLIDVALDETFVAADAHERSRRVEQVGRLLAEEGDPLVRSMAKAYADQLAGRLDLVRSADTFRALEASVKKALATAGPPPAPRGSGATAEGPRNARIRPKPPGSSARAEIVGALIEYPELLDDAEVESHLSLLEGPSAQTVAALRRAVVKEAPNWTFEQAAGRIAQPAQNRLDGAVFLAQIPPAIQAFASERLAAPKHETLADARGCLIENVARLRGILLGREVEEIAREQHKSAGDGDMGTELLREALEKARRKQGVK